MGINLKVFSDFDGTITKLDVGNLIFKTFAGNDIYPLIELWKKNQISSRELLTRECQIAQIESLKVFTDLIDKQSIDDHFIKFVNFCKKNNIEIFILSDGLDYYINSILKKYNLDFIPFYANKFNYRINDVGNVHINPSFPFTDSECTSCGNCKRNHVLYHKADDEISVYIGDGYSDRCPAEFADIVFGKGELLSYCSNKKIPCFEFKSFSDIIIKFEEIISKKKLNQKKRAELKRKEILLQG